MKSASGAVTMKRSSAKRTDTVHPAAASFIYTLCAFALIINIPFLSFVGFAISGITGAVVGGVVGMFFIVWIGCWFMDA